MSPEFLSAFAPYLGNNASSPDDHANIMASILSGPAPQPNLSGIAGLVQSAPHVQTKRTIGNVLHDLFTDHVDAQGVPVSEKIARLGDAFINAARNWRGENPVDTVTPMRNARLAQAEWQQRNAELARQQQAREALGTLLTNPTPENQAALARLDPETLMGYEKQASAEQLAQQEAQRQSAKDAWEMNKPYSLGGTSYVEPTPGGPNPYEIKQAPLPPGFKYVSDGTGQMYVVDDRTGKPVQKIGNPKPVAPKVTWQTIDGKRVLVDDTGRVVPGSITGAAGNTAAPKTSSAETLALLDNVQKGFDDLHKMGALPGEGTALDALGRTGVGQFVGEQLGNSAAQKRLEINKNISNLQQQMLKSLPASATRTRFEQEMLQRGLPDPMKMSYATAKTVIKQLRDSYTRAVNELQSGSVSAPASTIDPAALAEARRRGLVK